MTKIHFIFYIYALFVPNYNITYFKKTNFYAIKIHIISSKIVTEISIIYENAMLLNAWKIRKQYEFWFVELLLPRICTTILHILYLLSNIWRMLKIYQSQISYSYTSEIKIIRLADFHSQKNVSIIKCTLRASVIAPTQFHLAELSCTAQNTVFVHKYFRQRPEVIFSVSFCKICAKVLKSTSLVDLRFSGVTQGSLGSMVTEGWWLHCILN